MANIYDYLKENKDTNFSLLPFNEVDVLLCSTLSYCYIKSFRRKVSFNKFLLKVNKENDGTTHGHMTQVTIDVVNLLLNSKRYEKVKVSSFFKITNSKTQFAACIFYFPKRKVIAFEGTDNTSIGWYENFKIGYQYPTYTQSLGGIYLNRHIHAFDKNVIICGHSKGGNLAITSSMLLLPDKQRKITKIYNFDGPGILKKQLESNSYKRIKEKIVNYMPEGSYIGQILFNNGNVITIESDRSGLDIHYPNSWKIVGSEFKTADEKFISRRIHQITCELESKLSYEDIKNNIDTFIKTIDELNEHKKVVEISVFKAAYQLLKDDKSLPVNMFKSIMKLFTTSLVSKKINNYNNYCDKDCSVCEKRESCKGCKNTDGHPFKKYCYIAEYIKNHSYEDYLILKDKIISKINDLKLEGFPLIEDLECLHGNIINLLIMMPNDKKGYLLDDSSIYLAKKVTANEKEYYIVANEKFIFIFLIKSKSEGSLVLLKSI